MDRLSFDKSYFEDKERFGFYVPEMMKRAWAAQLKILSELKIFFEKNNLKYFADFGTLLGAIRHKGVIPWDDDIDISMSRKDFNFLIEHADEVGGGVIIRSIYSSDSYNTFHAVATNSGGAEKFEWDEKRMEENYGCPFFCYVDIFPLDYVYRDPQKYKIQQGMYYLAYKLVYDCATIEKEYLGGKLTSLSELKSIAEAKSLDTSGMVLLRDLLKNIETLRVDLKAFLPAAAIYLNDGKLRNQLCRITDKVAQMCDEQDADMVDYCPHMANTTAKLWRRKEWFSESMEYPFENTTIAVPKEYDLVLKSRFGENYMTPVMEPSAHDYPFYRTMIEVLIDGDTGELYQEYQQKAEILASVDAMIEVQAQLNDNIYKGAYGTAQKILGDLQECAIAVGGVIEDKKGEGTWLVKPFEEYCEGIYELYNAIDAIKAGETDTKELNDCEKRLGTLIENARAVIVKGYHQDVPDYWIDKLTKSDGTRKKVMIYSLSAVELIGHSNLSLQKINKAFEEFDKVRDNFCVLFCFPPKLGELLHKCHLSMSRGYDEVINRCCSKDYVIVPKNADLSLSVSVADAYYGDECPLLDRFKVTGRPVMIQDYTYGV